MLVNYLILLIIFILMAAILLHPTICVAGAAAGLLTWFNSVLPSLFPFMVLTGLLIRTGVLKQLSDKLRQLPLTRNLPITPFFAILTGLLCGYPMGIRTVSDLKQADQLSRKQLNILYAFVNQPGPMFILGYALPLCHLPTDGNIRFLVAFYGGVLSTALLALIGSLLAKKEPTRMPSLAATTKSTPNKAAFSLFEEVLMSAMTTLTKIGGYMILFSLFAALLAELLPEYPLLRLILSGFLEMTSGISLASENSRSPYLILGFISFGGLSVAAQSFTLGSLSGREQLRYLSWKSIQTVISIALYGLLEHI